nr:MAG TPA: hypothetical protein [Caudoviricetes sp.]
MLENYMDKVLGYSQAFMVAESMGEDISFILNAELAYDVAKELREMRGRYFVNDDEDSFEKLLARHKVLCVENICYDGGTDYVLQPVFNEYGETIPDEPNIVYIESKILDNIDKTKINCYEFIEL